MGIIGARTSARVAVAATLAAALVGSAAATALPPPPPLMTYITALNSAAPQVWVSEISGSAALDLGPASSALISPDGTRVAAISIQKGQSGKTATLLLYATSGGSPTTLAQSQQFMQLLAWSPDSKLMLVEVGASPAQLRVIDTATEATRTIATGVIDGASFSPSGGDQIVYARAAVNTARVNIFTTSPTGTDTRQLTSDGLSEDPLWGPHGIAYSHETLRPKNPYPSLQLWFMSSAGSGAHQLAVTHVAKSLEGLTPIAFSSNGKHLLANLIGPQGSDQAEAYVVDLSGAKPLPPRNLTGQPNGYIGDAISSDGDTILVTKGVADNLAPLSIETIPWSGGKPTVVIAQGAYASWDV